MTLDRQTKGGPGSTAAKAVALLTRLIPKRPGGGSPLTAREYVQQWHAKESKRIAIVLTELQERKDKLVEAFVYRQAIDQDTYRQELDKLNEEITLADMAAHDAKLEAFDAEGHVALIRRVRLPIALRRNRPAVRKILQHSLASECRLARFSDMGDPIVRQTPRTNVNESIEHIARTIENDRETILTGQYLSFKIP